MEFKTETFIPAVIGIMLTLILVVSIMIPMFVELDDQLFMKNSNYGAVGYARLYEAGDDAIDIVIDETTDTVTVDGVDIQIGSQAIIAASPTVQVVYNKTEEGYQYPLSMMVFRDSGTEQHEEAVAYVDLESVKIASVNKTISIAMSAYDGDQLNVATFTTAEDDIFYLSASGPYGIYDHTALNEGVNVNGSDYLGLIVLDGDATATTYGVGGTWSYRSGAGVFASFAFHATQTVSGTFPAHTAEPYICNIDGTFDEHDGYDTISIAQMTIRVASAPVGSETIAYDGFYIIAPVEYSVGMVPHAEIMQTVLWLLPVLVVLGCMVIAAQYMTSLGGGGSGERPTIRRDKPKER